MSISESCLCYATSVTKCTLLTDPYFLAKNQLPDKGYGIITITVLPASAESGVVSCNTVMLAYKSASYEVLLYEVRALASSWNIFYISSISEIMSAGF